MSNAIQDKKQPLVRIDSADKMILEQLSAKTGQSTPRLLHRAVTNLKKIIFFEQMNSGYRSLRDHPELWKKELEDRTLFEKSIADGIE